MFLSFLQSCRRSFRQWVLALTFFLQFSAVLPAAQAPPEVSWNGTACVLTVRNSTAGRTYFMQWSSDLTHWLYLPWIDVGGGNDIAFAVPVVASPQNYYRLQYTDLATSNPYNDDFDGDGLSNYDEISGATGQAFGVQTNPLNPDSDGDWANDREEFLDSTDPTSQASAPLVLCYLKNNGHWWMDFIPQNPPTPWEPPYPIWYDGYYSSIDSRGVFPLSGGMGGPLFSPVIRLKDQSLGIPPDISSWNMRVGGPWPQLQSYATFRSDGEGSADTQGGTFWLRGPRSPTPITRHYIKTTLYDNPQDGLSITEDIVSFTLVNDNLSTSQTFVAELSSAYPQPNYTEYSSVNFSPSPVEVVDKNKNSISKLKVGSMSEPGVLSGTGTSAILDIGQDSDRFFVRVKGGTTLGGVSVKVSTSDNPIAAYNDNATQIDLVPDGDDAISPSLLLVSDDVDDGHRVDNIEDDDPGDRTHRVQLGGNFKINEIKYGNGAWQTLGLKIPVPVEKTVTLDVVILRLTIGGSAVILESEVLDDLKRAQERYAQVGIRLNWSLPRTEDPPNNSILAAGLNDYVSNTLTAEEKALFDEVATTTDTDMQVFYVGFLSSLSRGASYSKGYFADPADAKYTGNVIISTTRRPYVLAHEIGHILLNTGEHADAAEILNLMHVNVGGSMGTHVTEIKRLDAQQGQTIRSHFLSK